MLRAAEIEEGVLLDWVWELSFFFFKVLINLPQKWTLTLRFSYLLSYGCTNIPKRWAWW